MSETITAQEAFKQANMHHLVIIDVRTRDEWTTTGIPKFAYCIEMGDPEMFSKLRLLNITQNSPIAVICAAGVRSKKVQNLLKSSGYTEVYNILEGMIGNQHGIGWLQHGLPVQFMN